MVHVLSAGFCPPVAHIVQGTTDNTDVGSKYRVTYTVVLYDAEAPLQPPKSLLDDTAHSDMTEIERALTRLHVR